MSTDISASTPSIADLVAAAVAHLVSTGNTAPTAADITNAVAVATAAAAAPATVAAPEPTPAPAPAPAPVASLSNGKLLPKDVTVVYKLSPEHASDNGIKKRIDHIVHAVVHVSKDAKHHNDIIISAARVHDIVESLKATLPEVTITTSPADKGTTLAITWA